jgi:prolyl oligopeptidase
MRQLDFYRKTKNKTMNQAEQKITVSEAVRREFLFPSVAAFLIAAFCCLPVFAQNSPTTARIENVTNEYFGVKIVEPYRWMENLQSDEMQKWMRGQADFADAYLKKLAQRDRFLKRIEELSTERNAVGGVRRVGNRLYYFRIAPGDQIGKLVMRDLPGGAETILLDLDKMSAADGKTYAVRNLLPSPDGKYLAFSIYSGGSRNGEIRVFEIASKKDLGFSISNYAAPISWLPDSKSFTYGRNEDLPAGAKPEQREEKKRVRLHTLGANAAADREIFGYGVNREIEFPLVNDYFVVVPRGSKYAFGLVNPGVTTNEEFYFAPVDALTKPSPIEWRKIGSLTDELFASAYKEHKIAVRGDALYLAATKNAPRGKIIRLDLKSANPLAQAETIFADETEIVNNLRAAKDALYVLTIDGGSHKLRRVDYRTKKSQVIEIPANGSVFNMNADSGNDGLIFGTDSFVTPERFVNFNPRTNRLDDIGLSAPNKFDAESLEIIRTSAKSYDGTLVPLIVILKKGLPRNGSNPALLTGYGAYGVNLLEPAFNARQIAWLEAGGVLALAGVRGGGEYGEDWRLGGFQKNKPNTWKDFIACAEYLIAEKYTSPAHLAGTGTSAGGILINNAIVERPGLFAAAIVNVGLSNALRFETTENGAGNIAEFGSTKTEEGFKSLLAMDAYHKIKEGEKYPAVLFTHGANDTSVEPWMSAKMAARLQAASVSGKPILLRLNYDGGHGGGSNNRQANELQADIYAFLFEQLK